jgi:hypothetical protein
MVGEEVDMSSGGVPMALDKRGGDEGLKSEGVEIAGVITALGGDCGWVVVGGDDIAFARSEGSGYSDANWTVFLQTGAASLVALPVP